MILSEVTEVITTTLERLKTRKGFPLELMVVDAINTDKYGPDYIRVDSVDTELRDRVWAHKEWSVEQRTEVAKKTILILHVPKNFFMSHDIEDDHSCKAHYKEQWDEFSLKQKFAIRFCWLVYETYPFWRKIVLEKNPELN